MTPQPIPSDGEGAMTKDVEAANQWKATGPLRSGMEYLLPFTVTLLTLFVAFAWAGVYPFGPTAALREDGIYQYVGFFGWLSRIAHGDGSLFYSFSKSLGGQTISLFSYYLASPLNVVMALVPPREIAKALTILIAIKLSLMSEALYIFLRLRFGHRGMTTVLSSSAYGLSICNFIAGSNLMWLDGMIALPIICLGIHRQVHLNKRTLLLATTALMILANWYSAYMVCLFSIFWFIFELVELTKTRTIRVVLCCGLNYAVTMILALGISSFLFLPTAQSLIGSGTAGSSTVSSDQPFFTTSLLDLMGKYYIGATAITPDYTNTSDAFYCSCLIIIGTISYLFCSRDKVRVKVFFVSALLILALSEISPKLSLIWTGFSRADSYNPRFHFLMIFLYCICTSKLFEDIKRARAYLNGLFIPLPAILLIAFLFTWNSSHPYAWIGLLFIQVAIICFTAVMLAVYSQFRIRKASSVSIWVVALTMLTISLIAENAYVIKRVYVNDTSSRRLDVNDFSTYIDSMQRLSAGENDGSTKGVRSEHLGISYLGTGTTTFPTGENLALGTGGISHYSSAGDDSTKKLLGHLGYNGVMGTRGITYYNSQLLLMDSILSIGRVEVGTGFHPTTGLTFENSIDTPYGKVSLLRNDKAISPAFAISNSCTDIRWTDDRFDNQELFVNSLTGLDQTFYDRQTNFTSTTVTSDGWNVFDLEISVPGPLYLDLHRNTQAWIKLENEDVQSYGSWEFDSNIIYLGDYDSGSHVIIYVKSADGSKINAGDLELATLDMNAYQTAIDRLSVHELTIDSFSDGSIKGHIESNGEERLFVTVPFSRGWKASVNGEAVEIQNLDGMMSIPLIKGSNRILLDYETPGLKKGIIISIVSLVVAIPYCRHESFRKLIRGFSR